MVVSREKIIKYMGEDQLTNIALLLYEINKKLEVLVEKEEVETPTP